MTRASGDNFRFVFWIAVIPAAAAVAVILLFVREPERAATIHTRRSPISRQQMRRLDRRFWGVVAFAAVQSRTLSVQVQHSTVTSRIGFSLSAESAKAVEQFQLSGRFSQVQGFVLGMDFHQHVTDRA